MEARIGVIHRIHAKQFLYRGTGANVLCPIALASVKMETHSRHNMTSDQIELRVEKMTDALDRRFLAEGSSMTQHEYDRQIESIAQWADLQYKAKMLPALSLGDDVTYADINLRHYIGVITSIGKTKNGGDCLVKWHAFPFVSEETLTNLRRT